MKVDFLVKKLARLKHELKEEKTNFQYTVNKMNKSFDVIQKIEDYIGYLRDIINKAKLFDNNLATNPIFAAIVIEVLVDFGQNKEEIVNSMRSLFDGLEAASLQATPLELVLNNSMDTKEIPPFDAWRARATQTTQMPTKSDQPKASR